MSNTVQNKYIIVKLLYIIEPHLLIDNVGDIIMLVANLVIDNLGVLLVVNLVSDIRLFIIEHHILLILVLDNWEECFKDGFK